MQEKLPKTSNFRGKRERNAKAISQAGGIGAAEKPLERSLAKQSCHQFDEESCDSVTPLGSFPSCLLLFITCGRKINSVMFPNKIFICFAFIIFPCRCDDTVDTSAARRNFIQKQAVDAYKTTCLRLQLLANWMSVFFKLMSAWTNTTTKNMIESTQLRIEKDTRSIPPLPERPAVDFSGSQCSLHSLQVALKTYIHFQAHLLQLKSVLGKRLLKTGKAKLEDQNFSSRGRIGNLNALNKTAVEMFEKLKQSSRTLISQENFSRFKEVQEGPNTSLAYFKKRKNKILNQMQEVTKHTQNLIQTQTLFQTADFFQNLGKSLDRIFT
ncbi:uncharacterized protein CDAR_503911 [Caerostris darwini]|uniref:Uncharacterized protein n=1 Tax=Caerostris darwini TaxID=1538125 RepID=A0AAV4PEL6_9ARAC|nr:uncharacterized protein CDAR_503911 [Caerostris darwini]